MRLLAAEWGINSLKISFDEYILRAYAMSEHMLAIKAATMGKTSEASAFLVLLRLQRKDRSVHVKNYLGARLGNLSGEVMLFRSLVLQEENKSLVSPKS